MTHPESASHQLKALQELLSYWSIAVGQQQERVLAGEGPESFMSRITDLLLMLLAAHQAKRTAEAIWCLSQDNGLRAAIDAMDAAAPGATLLRHALEHADEYVAGTGRSQAALGRWFGPFFAIGIDRAEVIVGSQQIQVEVGALARAVDEVVAVATGMTASGPT